MPAFHGRTPCLSASHRWSVFSGAVRNLASPSHSCPNKVSPQASTSNDSVEKDHWNGNRGVLATLIYLYCHHIWKCRPRCYFSFSLFLVTLVFAYVDMCSLWAVIYAGRQRFKCHFDIRSIYVANAGSSWTKLALICGAKGVGKWTKDLFNLPHALGYNRPVRPRWTFTSCVCVCEWVCVRACARVYVWVCFGILLCIMVLLLPWNTLTHTFKGRRYVKK